MIRFTFKKGLVFREGLKRWTIIGRTVFGKIKLECDEGEPRTMSRDELYQAVLLNTMSIDEQSLNVDPNVLFTAVPRDLSTFPKHHQQNACRRHIYMQKLTDNFTNTNAWIREQTEKIAAEIGDSVVPSVSSIKRWWRRYRHTRCVTKLTDCRANSGRRRDGVIQMLFEEAVNEIYLDPQKRSGQDVYGRLVEKINQYNKNRPDQSPLTCPVESTVYRWLRNLDQNVVDEARLGKDVAARKARWVKGMATADFPLHRVEIDHTPLDVLVIDLVTNLPLGRPWITVAIDRYPSFGLRFSLKGASETDEEFLSRVNLAERDADDEQRHPDPDVDGWTLGSQLRTRGSIHSDVWTGTAAALAAKGQIAVYPVGGWWKDWKDAEQWDNEVRYSLVVSLELPVDVETDIYQPIAHELGVPIDVEIDTPDDDF